MALDIRIRFGRAIRRIREEQEINQEEVGTDGETVQSVDHRIAPGLFQGITWRKEHKYVAVYRVSFQIASQRSPVNFDMFEGHRLRTANGRRQIRLQLRSELSS